ncbi:hypothetical protein BDV18DRAFT_158592 [Aspergillus unguis]
MSVPERRADQAPEQEGGSERTLEVTFHTTDDIDSDEHGGVSIRRETNGDIIFGSAMPISELDEGTIERAVSAAAEATNEDMRRPRLQPTRSPRPSEPIHTWDELAENLWIEAERQAAEIPLPPELDNEPDRSTWPIGWGRHHDYFLWACRGSVPVVTDHLQAVFNFGPPIDETFVAARLSGVNAFRQITFLQKYLPGELLTLERAKARGVLYEANISHPEVRMGTQYLDTEQPSPGSPEYIEPILPCWAPPHWSHADDAFTAMYLGEDPAVFLDQYGFTLAEQPSLEFIRIRMAQIPFVDLTWDDLQAAKNRHKFLSITYPGGFPQPSDPMTNEISYPSTYDPSSDDDNPSR